MDRAGAAVNTELGKDVDEVALDGGLGDEEGTGDLLVRRSGCEETEHVDLSVGETWEWAAHALEHPGGEIGGEYRVAGCGTLDASPAASLSVMIQIGCASPGGKCADSVSKPVADSDCTRNFSNWSKPTEVPNSPVAMTASSASPTSRLATGRSDT